MKDKTTIAGGLLLASGLWVLAWQFFAGTNPPNALMFLLMAVAGGSLQVLGQAHLPGFTAYLPTAAAAGLALWGAYCYCCSPAWANAGLFDLLADYCAPLLGCAGVLRMNKCCIATRNDADS